jgi:hypothetical protein
MRQVDRKYFGDVQSGRLNSDDSPFIVGTNEWVNAENVRTGSTDKGFTGIVESVGGNTALPKPPPIKPYYFNIDQSNSGAGYQLGSIPSTTNTIASCTIGVEIDIIGSRFAIGVTDINGTNQLVNYFQTASDINNIILASHIVNALNLNLFGYTAFNIGNIITINAPQGLGSSLNGQTPSFIGVYQPGTRTPFSGGNYEYVSVNGNNNFTFITNQERRLLAEYCNNAFRGSGVRN